MFYFYICLIQISNIQYFLTIFFIPFKELIFVIFDYFVANIQTSFSKSLRRGETLTFPWSLSWNPIRYFYFWILIQNFNFNFVIFLILNKFQSSWFALFISILEKGRFKIRLNIKNILLDLIRRYLFMNFSFTICQ